MPPLQMTRKVVIAVRLRAGHTPPLPRDVFLLPCKYNSAVPLRVRRCFPVKPAYAISSLTVAASYITSARKYSVLTLRSLSATVAMQASSV